MKSKEVLQLLKISRVTLSKYVKSGKIRVEKLPNGYYSYNEEDVYRLIGTEYKRKNVIYARVSTNKQRNDLQNQIDNIKAFMSANGIVVDEVYSDIASGMTLDRKGFLKLLDDIQDNKIDTVYITYKDRLARLSYELVEKLFNRHNVRIKTIYNDIKSDEQELFEDLMSVIHLFSMKIYGKRRLAKKLLEESNKDETNKTI